jgi:hypothetical protein
MPVPPRSINAAILAIQHELSVHVVDAMVEAINPAVRFLMGFRSRKMRWSQLNRRWKEFTGRREYVNAMSDSVRIDAGTIRRIFGETGNVFDAAKRITRTMPIEYLDFWTWYCVLLSCLSFRVSSDSNLLVYVNREWSGPYLPTYCWDWECCLAEATKVPEYRMGYHDVSPFVANAHWLKAEDPAPANSTLLRPRDTVDMILERNREDVARIRGCCGRVSDEELKEMVIATMPQYHLTDVGSMPGTWFDEYTFEECVERRWTGITGETPYMGSVPFAGAGIVGEGKPGSIEMP